MFKIITVPFDRVEKGFDEELLNRFVLNKCLKNYHAEFFQDGDDKCRTIFMEYDPVLEKTADKALQVLNEPQKLLLERLKAWRKERAAKEGVPVYIIGTNGEFVDIVLKAPGSLEALKAVKGFGKGKISKYGEELLSGISMSHDQEQKKKVIGLVKKSRANPFPNIHLLMGHI